MFLYPSLSRMWDKHDIELRVPHADDAEPVSNSKVSTVVSKGHESHGRNCDISPAFQNVWAKEISGFLNAFRARHTEYIGLISRNLQEGMVKNSVSEDKEKNTSRTSYK